MSNYHLIGEDAGLSITIGGAWDGSVDPAPTSGTPALTGTPQNIIGNAKKIGLRKSLDKTNVKGMGSRRKQNRYHSEEESLEIEGFVPALGYDIPYAALGCYILVVFKPLSTGSTGITALGVITEWNTDAATNGADQTVKISVDLNPDYLPTS